MANYKKLNNMSNNNSQILINNKFHKNWFIAKVLKVDHKKIFQIGPVVPEIK